MKDNEIIQEATEAVTKGYPCAFYVPQLLEVVKNKEAEIEKKDTEIEILIRKEEALRDDISELTAEVERLTEEVHKGHIAFRKRGDFYCKEIKTAKTEAYREFAEKLKAELAICRFGYCVTTGVSANDIDTTLKELTRNLHGPCTETTDQTATSVSLIDGHIEE